ncbi:ribonuclease III [Friedmanniella endophytica]|uniref:Ribonuclease 3 n=1 Tax=Microlunatus kandeliicorticis TaxID=1759536 RepID=A0A7W3IW00_9ACTN|nr:ribonuclease III [Microlunatus kandeliicorticis]
MPVESVPVDSVPVEPVELGSTQDSGRTGTVDAEGDDGRHEHAHAPETRAPESHPSVVPAEVLVGATEVLDQLGTPVHPELLERALTHRSYAYEQGGLPTNERLEFLGDSVLGLVVTEHLFTSYPDLSEGQLAKLRAAVVNSRALADVARTLALGDLIRLGRGEETTGGRDKSSILADTMEALIGAVFVEHGIELARRFVHHLFDPVMARVATLGAGLDWKTSLQEICSTAGLGAPGYDVTESGPDHAKTFRATVVLDSGRYGPGTGRNKKEAEQNAAAIAFQSLKAEGRAFDFRPAAAYPTPVPAPLATRPAADAPAADAPAADAPAADAPAVDEAADSVGTDPGADDLAPGGRAATHG